ncbi:hypothetical protein C8R44DRAFT_768090 [Mycena epipterygia]|nr:hypothetical protein C8R44DRAFT_768090 [Mycena epipterygia]
MGFLRGSCTSREWWRRRRRRQLLELWLRGVNAWRSSGARSGGGKPGWRGRNEEAPGYHISLRRSMRAGETW